ncbi:uncharacterized protein B0I36DRAFT_314350 [Microdochium trichocladiopsis]|uniref:Mid2 domain-containing protein n=1 Tax=Microdochium trichocladiopsis TaxID=1682393 RepID=A0A9P9BY04_9PEZI|nr:uncharacterized protein B0I36DRAFT_314350 [Microdochium trichocladiopsis]KAH7037573.1 hypothetical protein B0I36DRAFT_314350 [Microdochium trichocladiopsis]
MVSTSLVRALMVALTVSATAQASWIANAPQAGDVALVERQADNNTSGSATTPTGSPTSPVDPTSTPTSAATSETTPATPTTPTSEPTTPTSTPTVLPPTTTPTTTPGESSTPTSPITTPPASQTTSKPESSTPASSSLPGSSWVSTTLTTTFTSTDANGSPTAVVSTIPTNTYVPLVPGSSQNDEEAQAKNKNIIIGVCVGVGGAIILGVAAVLFWRLRNKRRQEVDHDELQSFGTGYGAPSAAEKTDGGASSTRSPFQSTLESYHAPTQTNTASNF